MKIENILNRIKYFLWPDRCIFCQRLISEKAMLCSECQRKIPPLNLRYYTFIGNNSRCFQCISVYPYVGDVKSAIHRYKFRNRPNYAEFFGIMMALAVKELLVPGMFSSVTCVPLSEKRFKERGYNQSELLAKTMAKELSLPFENTLVKVKNNMEQHKLKAKDRRKNIANAYKTIPNISAAGKRFLLVDDIITTGNTVSECALMLKKAGAEEVICVSIAKVT